MTAVRRPAFLDTAESAAWGVSRRCFGGKGWNYARDTAETGKPTVSRQKNEKQATTTSRELCRGRRMTAVRRPASSDTAESAAWSVSHRHFGRKDANCFCDTAETGKPTVSRKKNEIPAAAISRVAAEVLEKCSGYS